MADDPERDVFPTKEIKEPYSSVDLYVSERQASSEKRFAHHLTSSNLEDQFYKMKEENLELKKSARKQEDELKRLATKMTRLLREKKSVEQRNSPGHKRDLELEEMVEDLQDKVRHLEKTNTHLREKILVARQQVISQARRPNPYSHIPPKVNSGNLKAGSSPYISSVNLRGKNLLNMSRKSPAFPLPQYAINLLEEAGNELSNLKMIVSNQKTEMEMYEQENEVLKQKLRMKEIEFKDEIDALTAQLTQRQRQHVQENLDLIRLHRELNQKNAKFLALQAQYGDVEDKMRILKLNHDHLVKDMEDLTCRFKSEQKKNLELLGELQKAEINCAASSELAEKVKSLQKENDFFRETNDKLMKSALAIEKERSVAQMEDVLREKLSNLESSLELQIKAKTMLEEELSKEKEKSAAKEEAYILLKDSFNQMKCRAEELEVKLNFLKSQEESLSKVQEVVNVNVNKEDEIEVISTDKVSEEVETLKSSLEKSESEHIKTIEELNNLREVLLAQYNINKVAQDEVKSLTETIEQQAKEFQVKLEEYSHLLDIRAARIQKLEKQLNDIAYGTKTFNLSVPDSESNSLETLNLSRGENVFEIHMIQVNFSADGLKKLYSRNSYVFLTWNFYEFELQSTPVASAEKPYFNFTAQYTVNVDDYFLCYLYEGAVTVELHESLGMDFRTIAACQLKFSDVVEKSGGRIHGTQYLIGVDEQSTDFGTIEFWVQLKMPVEQSFMLFKEKMKALKYIHSNKGFSSTAVNLLQQPSGKTSYVNELHIKIIRGINLKSGQKDVQPSAFCVYKFYDLPDQDTAIVPASNSPEFSDHRTFSLYMDPGLEKYLKNEDLLIYVFDDNEPDITSHIGRASVSLQPLVKNKAIKGIFELHKGQESGYGAIEVLIYWQHDYSPNMYGMQLIEKMHESQGLQSNASSRSSTPSISDEKLPLTPVPIDNAQIQPPVPKPRSSIPSRKETSTPILEAFQPNGDTDISSPKLSPVHTHIETKSETPKPAQRSSKSSNSSDDIDQTQLSSNVKYDVSKLQMISENESSDISSHKGKTYFGDVSDEESNESEIESDDFSLYGQEKHSEQVPAITIVISRLLLNADAAVLQDSTIKMLYVEYVFLDYPAEELETPFSLPKAEVIEFNFKKVFPLKQKDIEKWNLLSEMIYSDSPMSSIIKFTVVSEPPEDEPLDCEDIGYGFVDFREILRKRKDKIQEEIKIYDAKSNATEIGYLSITIQALDVLLMISDPTKS